MSRVRCTHTEGNCDTAVVISGSERGSSPESFEVAVRRGLTPLVGREHEIGLLSEHWERAKHAEGQVVLLSGEPGIGKSRLVQVMREQAERRCRPRLEFRCSPYHQNSAFYPIIEHLQRLLQFIQRTRHRATRETGADADLLSVPAGRYGAFTGSVVLSAASREIPGCSISVHSDKNRRPKKCWLPGW